MMTSCFDYSFQHAAADDEYEKDETNINAKDEMMARRCCCDSIRIVCTDTNPMTTNQQTSDRGREEETKADEAECKIE